MKKRLLSLALALVFCLSLLPGMTLTAKAEAATGVSTWSELCSALQTGGDYQLTADVTWTSGNSALYVLYGVTVTLDLNGHNIDRGLTTLIAYGYVIKVEGNLTITDTSKAGSGTITGGRNIISPWYIVFFVPVIIKPGAPCIQPCIFVNKQINSGLVYIYRCSNSILVFFIYLGLSIFNIVVVVFIIPHKH